MLTHRPLLTLLAQVVSVLGHPLLTLPVCASVLLFRYEARDRAIGLSALLLGGLFVPLVLTMYRHQASGVYTNFDVSDQGQRQRWYWLPVGLLAGVALLVFITDQTYLTQVSLLCATLLLGTSQLVNQSIKSSLHVSLNTYLACLLLVFEPKAGWVLLSAVPLVSWSRYQLGRHTPAELLMGGLLGLSFGGMFLLLAQ